MSDHSQGFDHIGQIEGVNVFLRFMEGYSVQSVYFRL